MDKQNLQEVAKANREAKQKSREDELRKVTTEDNVLGVAGNMLGSNRTALKALDSAIEVIEFHLNQIKEFKKKERDNFARVMFVFDDIVEDYSSEQWDEDQNRHQENLDALVGLRDAMKEEVKRDDRNDSGSDNSSTGTGDGLGTRGEAPAEDKG